MSVFSPAGCTGGDIPIVLECLDVMVNKRKRQVRLQLVCHKCQQLVLVLTNKTIERKIENIFLSIKLKLLCF